MRPLHIMFVLLLTAVVQIPIPAAAAPRPAIVIDPGHGGVDGGTQNEGGNVLEKDLNLQIAKRLAEKLRKEGYHVEMTREDDRDVTGFAPTSIGGRHRRDLMGRVQAAKQKNAYLFISIHGNHGTSRNRGALVFFKRNSLPSYLLAANIQGQLNHITGYSQTPLKGRYYVLTKSEVPCVLIEYGYLSNPAEVADLMDAAYQNRIVELISRGVWRFLAHDYLS